MRSARVILKPYGDIQWEKATLAHLGEIRHVACRSEQELIEAICDADILIADVDIKLTRKVIVAAKRLKGIMACSIGVDYVDVAAATEAGVYVANLPDYCGNAVAEFTIGLLFTLGRRITQGIHCVLDGNWEGRRGLRGFEVMGKRLGVIGFGKIGRAVAQKAIGLGMTVSYFDPYVKGAPLVSGCSAVSSLTDLLKKADVVSIHTALTQETRNLLTYAELSKMKPSAVLINVARGGIVNEDDLYRALAEGRIAGAALDVLTTEPVSEDHPLLTLDNVIITPHMAWNTHEAKMRAEGTIIEQVTHMIEGRPPKNLVNEEVLHMSHSQRN